MGYKGNRAELIREYAKRHGIDTGQIGAHVTPAPIGTGPKGETCGSCKWMHSRRGYRRSYAKCGHQMAAPMTHGAGTDIRLKWAACRYWEPKQ